MVREGASGDRIRVHPLAALAVRQKAVPLDHAITANTRARVVVVAEDDNLRNTDTVTGRRMTRVQFVAAIRAGEYPDYMVRKIHGLDTPVSKPTPSTEDNLG